jgi:hypothetical protein
MQQQQQWLVCQVLGIARFKVMHVQALGCIGVASAYTLGQGQGMK